MTGLFLRKNHLLRCWGWLSLLNWIGILTFSLLLKLPPGKLEPWFVLWSFSPEIVLHLFKSTIRLCMEYCCYVWAGAPSCYLELLDKLQKRICRAVGPSLATSLEPLAHHQNVASLSLFYRYYFAKCSSELAQLVPLPFSRGTSTRYSDRLHGFPVTIPSCYKDVSVNSSFPCTATTIFIIFMTFWCFTKFSFHRKWSNAWLLVINMVYISCLTSCRTT